MNRNPVQIPPPPHFASLEFPKNRAVLHVLEVATRLQVSRQHVLDLIEEGRLRAINIANSSPGGRKSYRIPVEAWEAYLRENLL